MRRQGHSPEDAQDLTQSFFARLLEKRYLGQVGPQKGKFRSFLLAALRHFLSDQRNRPQSEPLASAKVSKIFRISFLDFPLYRVEPAHMRLVSPANAVSPPKPADKPTTINEKSSS